MSYIEKEKLIKADIASIENRVRHAFNQGYDLGYKEGKANCSKNSTGSTTKNNLAQERYQDLIEYFGGENIITDIVLNDKNMFKAWLDRVRWYAKRVDELAREVEKLKGTTKNDLEVTSELDKNSKKLEKDFGELDCISRAQAQTEIEMNAYRYTLAKERGGAGRVEWHSHLIDIDDAVDIIRNLPSVTPIRPKGHWIINKEKSLAKCSNCKFLLKNKDEIKLFGTFIQGYNYCPNCGSRNEVKE